VLHWTRTVSNELIVSLPNGAVLASQTFNDMFYLSESGDWGDDSVGIRAVP
jgi:hypothetical protein